MTPPLVIKPSRNRVIQMAWAGLRADERKAKKEAQPSVAPAPAKKAPKKVKRK